MDIREETYIVESENIKDKWYTCNIHTGYCFCPVGSTCAPCKHKSAVAKYTGKANFIVTPNNDPIIILLEEELYNHICVEILMTPSENHKLMNSLQKFLITLMKPISSRKIK